jgi:hypothetical protein
MENLSAIQKLDKVLEYLCKDHLYEYKLDNVVANVDFLTDDAETYKILLKLKNDGFAHFNPLPPVKEGIIAELQIAMIRTHYLYSATFEGQLFNELKGYGQKQKDDNRKRFRETVFNVMVGTGTSLAGLYALIEMISWVYKILLKYHVLHTCICACR